MAKYLVTGGAGFIGCNLTRFLLDRRQEVVVLDDFSTGKRSNLADIANRIDLREADVRDRQAVQAAMAGCAAVFHQAALGSVPRSVADPLTTHDVNVNGTIAVLEAARATGTRRVIFAASSSAYGEREESPKHEGMVPMPISPYAASKVACEAYMSGYAASYGLETLCLRYFNVFGPYQDPQGPYAAVIPAFVSRLLRGQRPVIFGDGEQSRDFCYIDNACQANWLAACATPKSAAARQSTSPATATQPSTKSWPCWAACWAPRFNPTTSLPGQATCDTPWRRSTWRKRRSGMSRKSSSSKAWPRR